MKKSYDFSESVRNPYIKKAKKQLTIRLDEDTINYFRELSEETGIPYQSLINLYLRECALERRKAPHEVDLVKSLEPSPRKRFLNER